ncbi:MAG: glycosyltransferase family 4 protein [Alphaproteobacteria bacterium]|nr:glycosyltransferase family 4 protein [Alphaproteobacteria bacterium]
MVFDKNVNLDSYKLNESLKPWPSYHKKPVVLQILSEASLSSSSRAAIDIAAAVHKAGGFSFVASSGGPLVGDIVRSGAKHIELPLNRKNPITMRFNVMRLLMLIWRYKINIIHLHHREPAPSVLKAIKRAECHLITTFQDLYDRNGGLRKNYYEIMTKGDKIIAVSDFMADVIRDNYSVPEDKIRVIHQGVDLLRFDPERVGAERLIQLSSQWRLPDGVPIVLMPTKLLRWKGHEQMIQAMARLRKLDFFCLMIGYNEKSHNYYAELEALIQQHGLSDKVYIYNECKDMPAAYMLSDVVVCPSIKPEPFGCIISEAQAMGRPVVAADHGGVREQAQFGRMVWLVPPNNPGMLADAIAQALHLSVNERKVLAREAIANVHARFSKELMCEKTLQVYWEILRSDLGS